MTDTIEIERRRMVKELIEDGSTRRSHEERVAALCLAADMLDPANDGIRYSTTVGKTTVTAQVSGEACQTSFDLQQLIDKLNAS